MTLNVAVQWLAFAVFAFISIGGALGMTTTMSMFRSGIFLMASFFGVAGLFLLLSADLIGLLQVMMYTGGMLVMILFMLLFSHDPGGERMSSMMELPRLERFFSLGLAHDEGGEHERQHDHDHDHEHDEQGGEESAGEDRHHDAHGSMSHDDMSMFTPQKRPAALIALCAGLALLAVYVLWPGGFTPPPLDPSGESASRVGHLLMGKYMIAFEGAGLLILLGIVGAVFLARPSAHPDAEARGQLLAAVDEPPVPLEGEDDLASERRRRA